MLAFMAIYMWELTSKNEQRLSAPSISQPPGNNCCSGVGKSICSSVQQGFAIIKASGGEGARKVEGDDVDSVDLREHLHCDSNNGSFAIPGEHFL